MNKLKSENTKLGENLERERTKSIESSKKLQEQEKSSKEVKGTITNLEREVAKLKGENERLTANL